MHMTMPWDGPSSTSVSGLSTGRRLIMLIISLLIFSNTLMIHTKSIELLNASSPRGSRTVEDSPVQRPPQPNHSFILSNSTTQIALVFTTGGRDCGANNAERRIRLVERVWNKLVTSIHSAVVYQPQWHIFVRFVQDGWIHANNETSCIDWHQFEERLMRRVPTRKSPTSTSRPGGMAISDRIHFEYHRVPTSGAGNSSSRGIGGNMRDSYASLQNFDYITNIEDDVICHRHWLLELYTVYVLKKRVYGGDMPLLATAYNSNFTTDTIVSHCGRHGHGGCLWKQKVFGPNYFMDNLTFHSVVRPAFEMDTTATASEANDNEEPTMVSHHPNRPDWLKSINGWDSWVLHEYLEVLRNRLLDESRRQIQQQHKTGRVKFKMRLPPGVLVLQPSQLQHVELEGALHHGNRDVAADFVTSSDEEQ